MADHREPNFDYDGASSSALSFQKTVVLRDWWLIKCSNEFEGKRFGVAGAEESAKTRAMRVFKSSPIIKALDVFTLQASDGIFITLRGFLNKELVIKNGFKPEIAREFIFGFPPRWERICNNCFKEVPLIIEKASSSILSPCKYSKENLEDNPAESRDKSSLTETNTAVINKKDGSRARDKKTATKKSLHRQSKSRGKNTEDKRKLKRSEVKNTTNDGYHGSIGLNKAKSGDVEEDEGKAIYTEDNERKHGECKTKNRSIDGDRGSEILDKAKSRDVEIYEGVVIDNEVTLPPDGCGRKRGEDRVGRVTTRSAARELLTSEQRTDELKVARASPHSLFKDSDKTSKPGKQGTSKKSGKILKSGSNHYVNIVKNAGNKKKLNAGKVQNSTTNDGDHDSEGLNKRHSGKDSVGKLKSNSNPEKKRKSKKSVKNLKSDCNVVTPMNNSGSEANKAEEHFSWERTRRKIDFDVEVTPDKPKANTASTDSLGQKRSRSGRVLMASLEFWRNQIPVYDMDRNLIQVKEDRETNSSPSSNGKVSDSRKRRK